MALALAACSSGEDGAADAHAVDAAADAGSPDAHAPDATADAGFADALVSDAATDGGVGLSLFAGEWREVVHYPIVNTCPGRDSEFMSTGWFLIITATSAQSGTGKSCTATAFGWNCNPAYESAVKLHDGYATRSFDFDFTETGYDCVLHQYTTSILTVAGSRMTMVSVSDENVTSGTQCAELDASWRRNSGKDVPIDHCHVVEHNELTK